MQLQEKKRQKEEREIVQRLKPLAKLQTGQDFEDFVEGIICMWSSFSYILYIPNHPHQGNRRCGKEYKSYSIIGAWA